MEVKIKTLTPLWTGGVEAGKCDRIHETGILGSLRWWMEVLVRGMGGNACDPTEQKCSAKNGLCDVCKIFGAEGQKRRFRLEVVQDRTQSCETVSSKIELKHYRYQYRDKQGKEKTGTPTWYFPKRDDDKPKLGTFSIQVQNLHPSFKPEVIGGLTQFIADWSALGSRPQMGFGVIQIMDKDFSKLLRLGMRPLYEWLKEVESTAKGQDRDLELPSLQNIFLAKIQPKNSFTEKTTFNLKYDLRKLLRTEKDVEGNEDKAKTSRPIKKGDKSKQAEEAELRHFIMGAAPDDKKDGKTEDKRMAAKVKISRPYKDEQGDEYIRVWGWIPSQAEVYKNGWNREKVVNDIHQHLKAHYTLHGWREMNSERDTVTANQTDVQAFLRSLLQLQEDN